MLVAAAVCPSTPLVVLGMPELRSACRSAIASVLEARPDTLIVVGGAEATRSYEGSAAGTLRPWGLDRAVGRGEPVLPLSLTVARLLLSGEEPASLHAVAFDATTAGCLALGESLGGSGERVALLVMADGSACLSPRAPGKHDEAAGPYNEMIVKAVGGGDAAVLAALDAAQADRLWVSGRAALQVLAGAAGGRAYRGRLLAAAAPYGVGYLAGAWLA
ncbi:hypothetical protein ACU635_51380 [[Actinomadura] parvosata]|uniref:hypothetical protein n=1 Tax=[Actinomadura] parvosata TaxID=1955412 RepID=UPI00406D4A6F